MFIAEGTIVDDKFEVVSSIGVGGMGVVYEAKQLGLDRLVALKLLSCVPSDAKEEVVRFEREALVLSKLQHINIVQFYAYGLWQNFPYIAMERVAGVSLQKKLSNNEPLPTEQIIDYGIQICNGLEHAHSHSIFHRDIKPSNIIISTTAEGKEVVKLIDFGLAKLVGFNVQKLTQTNTALGSVMYMSPEQCVGKTVDARSDIYSLGCLLYQCFTGEPPFSADNAVAVMFQQTNEPVDKCHHFTNLPEAVQSIIARCMSKDPEQRYQSCSMVRGDLMQLLQMEQVVSAPLSVARTNVSAVPATKPPFRITSKYFMAAMVLSAICLALVYNVATRDSKLANIDGKTAYPAVLETPKETITRLVRSDKWLDLTPVSTKQVSEALHHCAKDPTSDPNLLIEGYSRLVDYHVRANNWDTVRSITREAMERCKRTTDAERYCQILDAYHQSCEVNGSALSVVNQLEQTLRRFPRMEKHTRAELTRLLVRDYMRLGREHDAKPLLDNFVPVGLQQLEIDQLRARYKKTATLSAAVIQQRQKHQSAASSVIKLSEIYVALGDPQLALNVLQAELERKSENSEYQLLYLRDKLAQVYAGKGEWEKARPFLEANLKPLEDNIGKPDRPGVDDLYTNTARLLGNGHLRSARYPQCAAICDHWAKQRISIAEDPIIRYGIDLVRASAYRHVGRLSDAETAAKSIVRNCKNMPVVALANCNLACIYYRQANYKAALTHAEIAVALEAKDPWVPRLALYRLVLAQCLKKENRTSEAVRAQEKALQELKDTPDEMLRSIAHLCDDILPLDAVTSRPLLFQKASP